MDAVFVDLSPYLATFNSKLIRIKVRRFHSGLALRHIVVVNILDLGLLSNAIQMELQAGNNLTLIK